MGTTSVWNKLADGSYVTDYYVSTPSNTTYSAPLPRCTYPFQVTTAALNKRTGRVPATRLRALSRAVPSPG